jgi:hypothetical protein
VTSTARSIATAGFTNPKRVSKVTHTRHQADPRYEVAACANTYLAVADQLLACGDPNVLLVDFLESGPGPFEIVNELNGVDHLFVPYADQCTPFATCNDGATCPDACAPTGLCVECAVDDDCADGWCDSANLEGGQCNPLGEAGDACERSNQCSSRVCDLDAGTCVACSDTDCPDGMACNAQSQCVDKLPEGAACSTHDDCASDACELGTCVTCTNFPTEQGCVRSVEYCEFGACLAKGEFGDTCAFDDQCISDRCYGGTCAIASCLVEADCQSAEPLPSNLEAWVAAGHQGLVDWSAGIPTLEDGRLIVPGADQQVFLVVDLQDGWHTPDGVGSFSVSLAPPSGVGVFLEAGDQLHPLASFNRPRSDFGEVEVELAGGTATAVASYVGNEVEHKRFDVDLTGDERIVFRKRARHVSLTSLSVEVGGFTCDELFGACIPKLDNGEVCLFLGHDACASGACDTVCVGCAAPANGCNEQFEYCDEGTCKRRFEDGETCPHDYQCQSGLCELQASPEETVSYNTAPPANYTRYECVSCASDSDCNSGACNANGECRNDGSTGSDCASSADCDSGICDPLGGICAECRAVPEMGCDFDTEYCEDLICKPKGFEGDTCFFDNQCLSDICNPFSGCSECDDHGDCEANEYCSLDNDCLPLEPSGTPCVDPMVCESGLCDPIGLVCVDCVAFPTPQGCDFDTEYCELTQCHEKGEEGDSCSLNDQCQSELCVGETCVEPCTTDSACFDEVMSRDPASLAAALDSGEATIPSGRSHVALPDGVFWGSSTSFNHEHVYVEPLPSDLVLANELHATLSYDDGAVPPTEPFPLIGGAPLAFGLSDGSRVIGIDFRTTTAYAFAGDENGGRVTNIAFDPGTTVATYGPYVVDIDMENGQTSFTLRDGANQVHSFTEPEALDLSQPLRLSFIAGSRLDTTRLNGFSVREAAAEFCDDTLQYCRSTLPNGDECLFGDEMCQSGICDTSVCVECVDFPVQDGCDFDNEYCHLGNCYTKGTLGDSCFLDEECASDICNPLAGCGECDAHADCGSDEFCDFVANRCEPKVPFGTLCADDAVCESGLCDLTCVECTALPQQGCDFGLQFCAGGQCIDKGEVGDSCGFGDQCTSGICNVLTGQCGECDSHGDCGSNAFCDFGDSTCKPKLSNGSACAADDTVCASGICDTTTCVECVNAPSQEGCDFSTQYCAFGSCNDKGGLGASCGFGDQCTSGICNVLTGQCGDCDSHSDCGSNAFCDFGDSTCKPKLSNGSACAADDTVCASGICDTTTCVECVNAPSQEGCDFSTQYCEFGSCNDRGGLGASCGFGDQCTSGICNVLTGRCGDCNSHSDCGSNAFCDFGDSTCKPKLSNGSACLADDAVCASGICDSTQCVECVNLPTQEGCDFSTEYCEFGSCNDRGAFGDSCGFDDQCESGLLCNATRTCVECDLFNGCFGAFNRCTVGGTCEQFGFRGEPCLLNTDCRSNSCSFFTCD